jgi:glycosyltransferase involved in cell wall biosynthesis
VISLSGARRLRDPGAVTSAERWSSILNVVHAATSAVGGGIQTMVLALARDASARGENVRVLFWRGEYPSEPGVPYVRLESTGRMRGWPKSLLSYLRVFRPVIVHLHGPTAGSIGAMVARLARVPIIVYTDHSPHGSRTLLGRVIRRLAARLPDLNVAISSEVARSLIEDCGVPESRVRLIPNGTPIVDPVSKPEGPSRRFLYVANLLPGKDHKTLLRALATLPDQATLALVGDGPQRGELEGLAQELRVRERVTFHGWLEDPWSIADGVWAYVHPARVEGGGIAVMEAMMRGLPILATATGGIPDIIQPGGTGVLVQVGDVKGLADSMRELMVDEERRSDLATAAREHAVDQLSIDDSLRRYRDLYRELSDVGGAESV